MKLGKLAGIAALAALLLSATSNDAEARKAKHPVRKPPVKARHAPRQPGMRDQLPNKVSGDTLTIYFTTNSWTLDPKDYQSIADFVHSHPKAGNWVTTGYCDERSTDAWNQELGQNRAKGVAKFIRTYGGKGPIQHLSQGEKDPADPAHNATAYRKNRRVVVTPGQDIVSMTLSALPVSQVYLLDATGSMSDPVYIPDAGTSTPISKWEAVSRYSFPKDATLYAFNSCQGVTPVSSLRAIRPDCSTPLWGSLEKVLEDQPGKSVVVLTDGEHNHGGGNAQQVITIAQRGRNQVSVGSVAVLGSTAESDLKALADATHGKYSFLRK
ncbi:MAG: OmpA family protein [Nanoarchaeota archaeon]